MAHISPAFNFGLPIAVTILCQLVIGCIIFLDVQKRVWNDEIKCDIWASLGKLDYVSYNFALFAFPLLSFAYIVLTIKNNPHSDWWHEKRRSSALFRIITHKAMMGFLSGFTAGAPFVIAVGIFLFAIGGALDSARLSLLGFQVLGGMIIFMPPFFAVFQFVVLTHFLSKKWVDHSYELFYGRYPVCNWPKHDWLDARRYYRTIMKIESNAV